MKYNKKKTQKRMVSNKKSRDGCQTMDDRLYYIAFNDSFI